MRLDRHVRGASGDGGDGCRVRGSLLPQMRRTKVPQEAGAVKVLVTFTAKSDGQFRAQYVVLPDDEDVPIGLAVPWLRGVLRALKPIEHRDGRFELRVVD